MEFYQKELVKVQIKAIAHERAISKARAKQLLKEAGQELKQAEEIEAKYYDNMYWTSATRKIFAATQLQGSSAEKARYMNVAYALLRGKPYHAVERTCRYPLNPGLLLDYMYELDESEARDWSLNDVKIALGLEVKQHDQSIPSTQNQDQEVGQETNQTFWSKWYNFLHTKMSRI